jgi:integrase
VAGATTGGEGVAARTISTFHAIFEHAVRLGRIKSNPAKGVRRLASAPRHRRLGRAEIAKLGTAMRAAETAVEHSTALAAIRLLLLTGFRRLEALGLQREWLNAEEASVRFPDTKSGAQVRVIARAAVDLLTAQPQTAKSPFFFPADWGDGHFIGVVRVLDRVCAQAREVEREDQREKRLEQTEEGVVIDMPRAGLRHRPQSAGIAKARPSTPGAIS